MYQDGYSPSRILEPVLLRKLPKPAATRKKQKKTKSIRFVACGGSHSMLLLKNGVLYTCGDNAYGQLGLGNDRNTKTFTQVESLLKLLPMKIIQIAAGGSHSLIVTRNRDTDRKTIWTCGE